MALRFTESLDHGVADVERPPLIPIGTYRWIVEKHPENDTIADGRYDVCDFQLKCIGPEDDVDTSELAAFGDTTNIRRRLRFLFNTEDETAFKRAAWQLKEFLTVHLGIKEKKGMSMKELLSESPNMMCLGTVTHRPDKNDPERMYDEIKKTAPLV